MLYDCWLQSVWTIHLVQQSAAVYQNSSGGPEKGRSTLNLCVSETLGCGCCSAGQWMATQQTRATHHAHNTSAFMSELSREHLTLSYRSATRMHKHTWGALLYNILMLHAYSVIKIEWFHRKVRRAESQSQEDILSPSHCHWWTSRVNPNIKRKYSTVTISRLAPESLSKLFGRNDT